MVYVYIKLARGLGGVGAGQPTTTNFYGIYGLGVVISLLDPTPLIRSVPINKVWG